MFTIPPGVYSEYGYIIALLVCLNNSQAVGRVNKMQFIIYEEDGKICVQRNQDDNLWSLPTSSITVNQEFAGYTVSDFSTSNLHNIIRFTLDTSEVKESYLNYINNMIISANNSNLCLHNNKFVNNFNINPMYLSYVKNRIKYN